MVTMHSVEEQLKHIHFNHLAWGRTEVKELPNILLADEQIFECVNGFYEGGFALLVATNFRLLLIDKKPLNFLTVEDLRFDMISEIDYSHRLFGARISISTGSKNLKFTSYNQPRLRKLITHVQHCMADAKKQQSEHQEGQNLHLEKINEQLKTYLTAQQEQQERLQQQLEGKVTTATIEPVKPSPELSDYLFAQSLLAEHQSQLGSDDQPVATVAAPAWHSHNIPATNPLPVADSNSQLADLYSEGLQEVFGKRQPAQQPTAVVSSVSTPPPVQDSHNPLEINALRIAYSKLPMALRNRKFGRPSFHAHSQTEPVVPEPAPVR